MFIPLIRASHPEPGAAVTVVAGLLALVAGHRPAGAVLVAATVGASQLAVGWANDAIDAERDAAVGRADKPVATGQVSWRTVAVAAGVAAATTVLLAVWFPPAAAVVAIAGLASALAYDWPLKGTAFSVLPYAGSFAALPAFVVLAVPKPPPVWLVAAGGLLGAGAHFANALPDLADDRATGIRGLPARLGPTGSGLAASALLLTATAVLVFGPSRSLSPLLVIASVVAPAALLLGLLATRRAIATGRRPVALFRAFIVVALIDTGLLLAGGAVL